MVKGMQFRFPVVDHALALQFFGCLLLTPTPFGVERLNLAGQHMGDRRVLGVASIITRNSAYADKPRDAFVQRRG